MINSFIQALSKNPTIFIFLRKILENNFKGEKEVLARYFVCGPEERVLDIGCGTGEFSVFFNPRLYIGIDIEQKYIAYAKNHYQGTFLVGDAANLPFADVSFQKIAIVGVLHHLDDPTSRRVLNEARRVLSSDGTILVMEDVNRPQNNFATKLLHRLDNGSFIRTKGGYEALVRDMFLIQENVDMQSGLCPYQVFLLKKKV